MGMLENLLFWGMTLTVTGKAIVIIAALVIHGAISKAHKISDSVVIEYHKERNFILFGLALIIIGYALEVYALGLFPF